MIWLVLTVLALAQEPRPTVTPSEDGVESATETSGAVEAATEALAERRFEDAARLLQALADAGGGPELRYLEALARYESGDLRGADRATEQGLRASSSYAPLLNLRGLVLADLGRGDEALVLFERVRRVTGDEALEGQVALNEGLVHLDRGDLARADAAFAEAARIGERLGEAELVARARSNAALSAAEQGATAAVDPLGAVAERLRAGDLEGARAKLPPEGTTRRERVHARIARAAVARAEGRPGDAALVLEEALVQARRGGLVRETALVLGELGTVHHLGGQGLLARERLREAADTVEGTSFRLLAIGIHVQAGIVDVSLGELARARTHLEEGRRLARGVSSAHAAARLDELEGVLADAEGRKAVAIAALERAVAAFEARGWHGDAARAATILVRVDPTARERALALFARAGDPLGPAHVGISAGLALARAGDLEGALALFVEAAETAEAAGDARVAAVARDNAVEALRALGHGEENLARIRELGLADAIERQEALAAAEAAYAEGMAAWEAEDWARARARFGVAWRAFEGLEERVYAHNARRGHAWALWNQAVASDPVTALPFFEEIVQEAIQIDDAELRVRARTARALAALEVEGLDPAPLLRQAAEDAEATGMTELGARAWAGLADLGDLADRASAARRAHELDPGGPASRYAMYSVAVDAYNADHYDLAEALAAEVLPEAGDLADAVTAVLEAAKAGRQAGPP